MTETVVINGRSFPVVGGAGKAPTAAKAKRSKYGNRKVVVDGIKFDSQREAKRWVELRAMELAGKIYSLRRQPSYILAPSVRLIGEKRAKPALKYTADFAYWTGQMHGFVVEDVKSAATLKTTDWRIRQHLMKSVHGIDVRIVK